MNKTAIIIGGGMGGLFTGAFLAKNGIRVTLLEKNTSIGGGLQSFHRRGKDFETGMHVMGGFENDGILTKICRYLGILESLKLHHIDHRQSDELYYHQSGEVFSIASGKEGLIDSIASYFPEEREGIRNYVDELYRLTEETPLFHLREVPEHPVTHSDNFTKPADLLIADFVQDSRLREILAYLNPLYGGVSGHSPAYIHALLNVLYIPGASRFIGGSAQLAQALARVIKSARGTILTNHAVVKIETDGNSVSHVSTQDGSQFHADMFISAIHPELMVDIMPPHAFPKAYERRLHEIPMTYSAFSVYIDFHPDSFPYIGHTCYYNEKFGNIWNQDETPSDRWPESFMYMTPPDERQGEYASRMLVHCPMSFEQVRHWEATVTGRRGDSYERWKYSRIEAVISKLENRFPYIRRCIRNIYGASPLTIRDYYNSKEGALFGYRKDCDNLMLSRLSVKTKINNLLLTGQNINLHGICGVPITAIMTAEAILGHNTLVKEINNANS